MIRKKLDLQAGVKYRGYGIINEYGEFEFIPEATGSRKGVQRIVKQGEGYSVSTTKERIIIHMNLPKVGRVSLLKSFLKQVDNVLSIFRTYEI